MTTSNATQEVNRDEPVKHLRFLQESLGFTLNKLDNNLKELLYKLALFNSSFPISAATAIFGAKKVDISNLYERTLLLELNQMMFMDV